MVIAATKMLHSAHTARIHIWSRNAEITYVQCGEAGDRDLRGADEESCGVCVRSTHVSVHTGGGDTLRVPLWTHFKWSPYVTGGAIA